MSVKKSYKSKIASKAYVKTARNGGEEGRENADNRLARKLDGNAYDDYYKKRAGRSRKAGIKAKMYTRTGKALLDRYKGGK